MAQRLGNIFLVVCLLISSIGVAQNERTKASNNSNYKDSTFNDFYKLRFKVAQAQINLLKNGGALLFRLKTNSNTISKLKASGNIDLATQLERETYLNNQNLIKAFRENFTFCPVYFFTSEYTDSVKQKKLVGIFLDENLNIDPNIKCEAEFYLIAESAPYYNSSLGLVKESMADKAVEKGSSEFEANIIIKNRFFIQLHKPFPYDIKGYSKKNWNNDVIKLQRRLQKFYDKNIGITVTPDIKEYIY